MSKKAINHGDSNLDGSSFDLLVPFLTSISEGRWEHFMRHISKEELILKFWDLNDF